MGLAGKLLGLLAAEGLHGLLDLFGRFIQSRSRVLLRFLGGLLIAGGHLLLRLAGLLTGLTQRLGR